MNRLDEEYQQQINAEMLQEEHDSYARLDNIELKEVVLDQLEENKLVIMLPAEFDLMPAEQVKQKYLAEDRPQVVLTDPGTTVNFTFSFVRDQLFDDAVEEYRVWAKELLQRINPSTIYYAEGLIELASMKNIAYMTSKISVIDGYLFSNMFFFSHHDKACIGTFTCPYEDWEKWHERVLNIIRTIEDKQE